MKTSKDLSMNELQVELEILRTMLNQFASRLQEADPYNLNCELRAYTLTYQTYLNSLLVPDDPE